MTINKQNLQQFRLDFANAVKALEQQYNVKINLGNIKYSTIEFSTKLEVINQDKYSLETQEFITNNKFERIGHQELQYGMIITCGSNHYKIIGCDTSKPKNCVQLKCIETGKGAKCSANFASSLL